MLVSMFVMYASSSHVGSPGKMWELLMAASEIRPIAGNAEGHLLTMKSVYGGLVGLTFLGGGFSATVDSQYVPKMSPFSFFLSLTSWIDCFRRRLLPIQSPPLLDTYWVLYAG